MSVEATKRKVYETVFEIGRGALHAMAPNDFELYACTFELIDSKGVVEEIFHFPVMPSAISVGRQSLVNIKKSGTAYISQFNNSFVGRNITLSGTFGKKFRILTGFSTGSKDGLLAGADLNIKTGYGSAKLLEKIIESSQKLDGYGNPKLLIFYNSTLNHNHVMEVLNFQMQQSIENNMMINWNIEIKSLANVDDLLLNRDSKRNLKGLLASAVLSKVINKVFDNINVESISKKI